MEMDSGNALNFKKVCLKNGKAVKLCCTPVASDCIIFAYNGNEQVGKCSFTFSEASMRKWSKREVLQYAKQKCRSDLQEIYEVNRIYKNGWEYRRLYDEEPAEGFHKDLQKECTINLIQVESWDFYKVGLGSAMFTEMQNMAIDEGCKRITAWYCPVGQFAGGAHSFYIRNGFTFKKDKSGFNITAIKELPKGKGKKVDSKGKE